MQMVFFMASTVDVITSSDLLVFANGRFLIHQRGNRYVHEGVKFLLDSCTCSTSFGDVPIKRGLRQTSCHRRHYVIKSLLSCSQPKTFFTKLQIHLLPTLLSTLQTYPTELDIAIGLSQYESNLSVYISESLHSPAKPKQITTIICLFQFCQLVEEA